MTAKNNIQCGSDECFVVHKRPFTDSRLSWEARGLLAYMLSNQSSDISNDDIVTGGPAQEHKVKRMLRELKLFGYIRRVRRNTADGLFEWVTEIYEDPSTNPDYDRYIEGSYSASNRGGFVYLAYSETGHYKIGLSIGPSNRIKILNTKMPVKVELVHIINSSDMYKAETFLHEHFADKRCEGEWFELDKDDVDFVQSMFTFAGDHFYNKANEVVL